MKYKTIIKIQGFIRKPLVKILFYLTGTILLLFHTKAINGYDTVLKTILAIIENDTTISVFTVGLFAMGIGYVVHWINSNLEEYEKTEADHRKIIKQYSGHEAECKSGYSNKGAFLKIHAQNLEFSRIHKNPIKKKSSGSYEEWEKAYSNSGFPKVKSDIGKENPDGVLPLSSISVFANSPANKPDAVVISDQDTRFSLPHYIHINSHNLLSAHDTTAFKSNETTIRLQNAVLEDNKLKLTTQRTTYYEMLMTNRCMDFEHLPHLTLRQIYEYKNRVTPLDRSQLSNQIGVNGMVFTSDGYALIEKRDLSKSTWKNKFAQPISLAMKLVAIDEFLVDDKISEDAAEKIFLKIISKTLKDNYGLRYKADGSGDYEFSLCSNLLGLARDLLEGGKPNFYFYVTLNITAAELKQRMEDYASLSDRTDDLKPLGDGKLKSDFYLIHKDYLKADYDYSMALNRKADKPEGWMYINRIQYPRSHKLKCKYNKLKHSLYWFFKKDYRRECCEALLVCIAYMQIYNKDNGED